MIATRPSRLADYAQLARPRIAALVLVTVVVGGVLAAPGADLGGGSQAPRTIPWAVILHAAVGTLLVAAGSSALNQLLEADTDGLMDRTRDRPLPAGRLGRGEVLGLGLLSSALGLAELALFTSRAAALVALATLAVYVLVYTPLKRVTTLNTVVGAIPGAAPPVIGWAAVRGDLDQAALSLFAIVFLWQFPHFLAIAWLNRDDYARAGLKMLPAIEAGEAAMTRRQAPHYALALIPASVVPTFAGIAGPYYLFGALVLGVAYLACALGFGLFASRPGARRLLLASLVYLPMLFGLMILDRAAV